jgi:CHAT domain-containing protein
MSQRVNNSPSWMPSQSKTMDDSKPAAAVPKRPNEVPTLDSYKPLASTDPDQFMAHLRATQPELNDLLALDSAEARHAFLGERGRTSRQRLWIELMSLAFSHAKAGRIAEALALDQRRMEIAELEEGDALQSLFEHTGARNRADVLTAIGDHHQDAGELGRALSAYLEAEAWYARDDELRQAAGLKQPSEFDRVTLQTDMRSNNLATISQLYRRLRNPEKAEEYTALAWKYSKRGASGEDLFMSAISRAEGAAAAGELDVALGNYQEALELALKLRSSLMTGQNVVRALTGMAKIYSDLRLPRRALALFERALSINETGGHQARQQQDLENIARVYLARGDLARAREAFERSLRLCSVRAVRDQTRLLWPHDGVSYQLVRLEPAARVLLELARLARGVDPQASERHIRLAAGVVEQIRLSVFSDDARVKIQEIATDIFDELVEQDLERYERSQAQSDLHRLFESVERAKSRVLIDILADQPLPPGQLPPELLAQEARLLERERSLEQQLEGSLVTMDLVEALDLTQRELGELWTQLQGLPGGAKYVALRRPEPITPGDLHTLLAACAEPTVLVNYFATPKRLIAIAVSSTSPQLHLAQAPVGRADLRSSVAVDAENPPALELRLPYWQLDISPAVIDPVRPLLEGHVHAVLVPHDVLHSLPIHALTSNGQEPIIVEYSASYLPSASLLRYCLGESRARKGPSLVMGAPERPDERLLPRAADEVSAIARELQSEAYIGARATRELFMTAAGAARCIHVVCHNQFDAKDPLASALRLSDGNLSGHDMLKLKLNADLVVLSACQSGVSKHYAGDELIGLVRALLCAGAPSIVVTLWNAYDATAKTLMIDFYRRYGRDPHKGRALAEAQRELYRAQVGAQEWAPFVIVGAWL